MGNKFQTEHMNEITVLCCEHNMNKQPEDTRKTHCPLYITKNIDKASPLLATAFASQEYLDCVIDFFRTNEQGYNEKFYTIELKKALVTGIDFTQPHTVLSHNEEMHENIALSYKEIVWKHNIAGTMGYDNWENGGLHG